MTQKQTNPKVKQKVITRPDVIGTEFSIEDVDLEKEEKTKRDARIQRYANQTREFLSLAEQVAQDKYFQRNHIWPGAKESFPFQAKMQTVDKYFPYAEHGPLFVDEPNHTEIQKKKVTVTAPDGQPIDKMVWDYEPFQAKIEAMKTLGHRYLLVTPGMTYDEAVEALA